VTETESPAASEGRVSAGTLQPDTPVPLHAVATEKTRAVVLVLVTVKAWLFAVDAGLVKGVPSGVTVAVAGSGTTSTVIHPSARSTPPAATRRRTSPVVPAARV